MQDLIELKGTFDAIILGNEEYPVDFDQAWAWIGYSTKQKALEMLEENFVGGEEFLTYGLKTPGEKGGRPASDIRLTVDCFKAFCMLAQTERGKQVRRYFIACEKELNKTNLLREFYEKNLELAFEISEESALLNAKKGTLKKRQQMSVSEIFQAAQQGALDFEQQLQALT